MPLYVCQPCDVPEGYLTLGAGAAARAAARAARLAARAPPVPP